MAPRAPNIAASRVEPLVNVNQTRRPARGNGPIACKRAPTLSDVARDKGMEAPNRRRAVRVTGTVAQIPTAVKRNIMPSVRWDGEFVHTRIIEPSRTMRTGATNITHLWAGRSPLDVANTAPHPMSSQPRRRAFRITRISWLRLGRLLSHPPMARIANDVVSPRRLPMTKWIPITPVTATTNPHGAGRQARLRNRPHTPSPSPIKNSWRVRRSTSVAIASRCSMIESDSYGVRLMTPV